MMNKLIHANQLIEHGLSPAEANIMEKKINPYLEHLTPELAWKHISTDLLLPSHPFSLHLYLFSHLYPDWPLKLDAGPAYTPDLESINNSNLTHFMQKIGIHTLRELHNWSTQNPDHFLKQITHQLEIAFDQPPSSFLDVSRGLESPQWFLKAQLNIVNSCFNAPPDKKAILFKNKKNELTHVSYGELRLLSCRVANSLVALGFSAGDAIAINMPMTMESIAIYLGIIMQGMVVVSIADSFSTEEISTRLHLANAKAIFTTDFILRDTKKIPLYKKVIAATDYPAIVLPCEDVVSLSLRPHDVSWDDFLLSDDQCRAKPSDPMAPCTILFSSGTTGHPKVIPWNHTTGIKSASDAFFHHNIQSDDIVAWPTNLGWMMGPWLIYATFINQATLAVYPDSPRDRAFGQFIQDAKVTLLGVIPALVAIWRQTGCMERLNWQAIKRFSSTGECSNAEDMLYLMSLAGYKPIIEYCGGTETGGAYLSSTVIEKNYPCVFTTPTMGMRFIILDEDGTQTTQGEVALVPPSLGLSTELIHGDHHQIYYADMPKLNDETPLRRHGDQVSQLPSGYYCVLGRVDDTMNLGGIKISSVEIERAIVGIDHILETAAIAITPSPPGPSQLVIYAATQKTSLSKEEIKREMQLRINQHLNPLFKIMDVVFLAELPKTASNKIMRRVLRKQYQSMSHGGHD